MLFSFRLVPQGKTGKEINLSAGNFVLSDIEDRTTSQVNRGGIADLPLLRTLLEIRQKSQEPSFCEVMDFFIVLAYASLAASRTLW